MHRMSLPLQEEAVQVTGLSNPQAAAEAVLSRANTATEWCVVKMGGEGAVLVTKAGEVHHAPAFKVRAARRQPQCPADNNARSN